MPLAFEGNVTHTHKLSALLRIILKGLDKFNLYTQLKYPLNKMKQNSLIMRSSVTHIPVNFHHQS